MKKANILVIDAQGGGLGKLIIERIRKENADVHITAVGTNSFASSAMLKVGADEAATGENSVVVASRKADVILGPVGIVIADAMIGEITPKIALSVAQARAKRILIPFNSCDNYIAGVAEYGLARLVDDALSQLKKYLTEL